MRLCTPVNVSLAAAAALLTAPMPRAHAEPGPDGHGFPITTRIHGGPDTYAAGGGPGTWYLDLTNTTGRTRTDIHPVVVLVDDKSALEPSQARLEFYDGARPHPVRFEETDAHELVGAFDDGFPGFTVAAGRTLTVKVRLGITADAVPNGVTAAAAVVQRHTDDGDWVGQSNDYRFGIDIEPDRTPAPGTSDAPLPFADELARTGLGASGVAMAATVALLVTGSAILLARRRR